MVSDLVIIHRPGSERVESHHVLSAEQSGNWLRLPTCLRHILIGPQEELALWKIQDGDEIYIGFEAYHFLLEIICGLRSPLLGETEVFGQFKAAVASHVLPETPWGQQLARFIKVVLEDTKKLRSLYLADLGSQSYGSILRREMKGFVRGKTSETDKEKEKEKRITIQSISILGAGHLTQEILPWISKDEFAVKIFARNVEKAKASLSAPKKILFEPLLAKASPTLCELSSALIIAAPMTSAEIATWIEISGQKPVIIFDLRSNAETDLIEAGSSVKVMRLSEVLASLSNNQAQLLIRKQAALKMISELAARRSSYIEYRPFGWDDVCA